MADPNPLAAMPIAESLAKQMNESLQWMSRMWGGAGAVPTAVESAFGVQPQLAPGPSMLMPTLDPNELEKRISVLKTVAHWLEMNRVLLHSTIQTLEMQRNAITAMQSMAGATQAGSTPSGAQAQPAASATSESAAAPVSFDPTLWWNALQEQFARVATAAAARAESASADSARSEPAAPPEKPFNKPSE